MINLEEKSLSYFKEIEEELNILNDKRLTILKYRLSIVITFTAIITILLWTLIKKEENHVRMLIQSIIIIGSLLTYFSIKYLSLYKKYTNVYKEKIITPLIKSIDETLKYKYSDGIDIETFESSKIFTKGIDEYNSEDLIRGIIGKTQLSFSEVHAQYKSRSTNSNGKSETTYHTIFKGIFFKADFNKNFKSFTVIHPDYLEGVIGNFAKTIQSVSTTFSDLKLVKLENTEFENNFEVYSEDPVEARYILSPVMMEKILNIKKILGYKIEISFLNSQIFIAIHIDENLFEPKLRKIKTELTSLDKYRDIVKNVIEIVEQLDLNTRIWSKE